MLQTLYACYLRSKFFQKLSNFLKKATVFKKMKKKKSSGCDGLSQEHLAAGAPRLTDILVKIL